MFALLFQTGEALARRASPRPPTLSVRVYPESAGPIVPKSFLGFSIEYPDLPDYTGTPQAPNELFVRLLQALGAHGNGPPTLRIGGNSGDQSWWNPQGAPHPPGIFTDITPDWVADLRATVVRAGTPVIPALNLGLNDPGNALAMARAVLAGLPGGAVDSFEIGNEPDLYTTPKTFHVGRLIQRRAQHRQSYSFERYLSELDAHVTALSGEGRPLAAGGFASVGWDAFTGELLDHTAGRLAILSAHSYPLRTCGEARRRPARSLISRLLSNRQAVKRVARLTGIARSHGVAVQVSEANSTVCGGVKGVSDTFATALWGTNALFGYLRAGVRGVNFHTWTGAFYAPVEFGQRAGRLVGIVHPLFYGMLLFARATADHAQLLATAPARRGGVEAWATRSLGGTLKVVLINKTQSKDRTIKVALPAAGARALVERMQAPSLAATSGVELAGKSFGQQTPDARMHGKPTRTTLDPRGGAYELLLPAASAAMLTVKPPQPK